MRGKGHGYLTSDLKNTIQKINVFEEEFINHIETYIFINYNGIIFVTYSPHSILSY
mgnify:CR=1 FL=1